MQNIHVNTNSARPGHVHMHIIHMRYETCIRVLISSQGCMQLTYIPTCIKNTEALLQSAAGEYSNSRESLLKSIRLKEDRYGQDSMQVALEVVALASISRCFHVRVDTYTHRSCMCGCFVEGVALMSTVDRQVHDA
jgi:hypothetical protein